jgi:hypothetical protein
MIWVVHHGSGSRILTFYPSRIPDPGVKKAPDPGSGSATLRETREVFVMGTVHDTMLWFAVVENDTPPPNHPLPATNGKVFTCHTEEQMRWPFQNSKNSNISTTANKVMFSSLMLVQKDPEPTPVQVLKGKYRTHYMFISVVDLSISL